MWLNFGVSCCHLILRHLQQLKPWQEQISPPVALASSLLLILITLLRMHNFTKEGIDNFVTRTWLYHLSLKASSRGVRYHCCCWLFNFELQGCHGREQQVGTKYLLKNFVPCVRVFWSLCSEPRNPDTPVWSPPWLVELILLAASWRLHLLLTSETLGLLLLLLKDTFSALETR